MQGVSGLLCVVVLTLSTACSQVHLPVAQGAQALPIRVDQPRPAVLPILVQTPVPLPGPSQPVGKLVQKDDLVYQGAFRARQFEYGGHGMAYDAARNSLWMVGHVQHQQVGELGIPEIGNGPVETLADGLMLTPFRDVLEGKRTTVDGEKGSGVRIGGLWPFTGSDGQAKLAVTAFTYYDAPGTQTTTHFVVNANQPGRVLGPYQTTGRSGAVAGPFAQIPMAWRALLGGSVLNGQCCISIIFRSSSGPSAWVIEPKDIGAKNPVPMTPLVWYPIDHPLGAYGTAGGTNPYFNGTGGIGADGGEIAPVFPEGTRSLLFFGDHGLGPYCYGDVTQTQALHNTPQPNGRAWCYDPEHPYAGPHGYPYVNRVWAYDAVDLAAAKAGTKKPWEIKPYAWWDLTFPTPGAHKISGVAYDPGTGRIFVGQERADGAAPLIHVYTIR